MLTPSSGAVGLCRALLWAGVVLGLALTAHLEAGAHLPPVEIIGLSGALLLAVSALAVRRRIRWPGGLALAGLGQYALNQGFSYLGGTCAASPLPDGGAHVHLAGVTAHGVTAHSVCAGAEAGAMSPAMFAWHALATVVTVGLLVGVERGVWLLASWLVRALPVGLRRLPAVRRLPVLAGSATPSGSVDLYVAPGRGPPSSALLTYLAT